MIWQGVALAALLSLVSSPATAQGPELVAGIRGRCEVRIAGRPAGCPNGAVYTILGNGRVMLSVALASGRVLTFVADSDRQVRPEDYTMYLSRLRIGSEGSEAVAQVSGTCEIRLSSDGRLVHRISCRATDPDRIVTTMSLVGNGSPVNLHRPQ